MSRENSRWSYTLGSRAEGVVLYDDGPNGGSLKAHIHHDSAPIRGQVNSFDLVRAHFYGSLDTAADLAKPVTERPSYVAMCKLAREQPELRQAAADADFTALGDLGPLVEEEIVVAKDTITDRFRVVNAADFSGGPPMQWVIRSVLPRAEVAVIYGESGSGKSFLALDLGAAITRGVEWRGKKTAKGRVVYVCAEGAGGFRQRLRAYAQGHDCQLAELPAVIADAPNMLEAADAAAVAKAIVAWGSADAIVIDTLAATTPGGNENSGEDMGRMLSHCKFIHQKTGALVVLIHHSGKDASKGARGWSGLRAAADAEIEVTRNGEYRAASVTKMKDGVDGEEWPFRLKVVPIGMTEDGEESSCVIEHTDEGAPRSVGRPSGKIEPIVYEVLQTMAAGGDVHVGDLYAGVAKKLPPDESNKRDMRKRDAKRGLQGLITKKLAFMHGDRVSLTTAEVATAIEGDWEK